MKRPLFKGKAVFFSAEGKTDKKYVVKHVYTPHSPSPGHAGSSLPEGAFFYIVCRRLLRLVFNNQNNKIRTYYEYIALFYEQNLAFGLPLQGIFIFHKIPLL